MPAIVHNRNVDLEQRSRDAAVLYRGASGLQLATASAAATTAATAATATATHRLLDHYLHTANVAAQLIDPQRDHITVPPARAVSARHRA